MSSRQLAQSIHFALQNVGSRQEAEQLIQAAIIGLAENLGSNKKALGLVLEVVIDQLRVEAKAVNEEAPRGEAFFDTKRALHAAVDAACALAGY